MQAALSSSSEESQSRIKALESNRNAAVQEASYLKAKLSAYESGSTAELPRIEREKIADLEKQFATTLEAKKSLENEFQQLQEQLENERRVKESAMQHAQQANARADASESSYSRSLSEFADLQRRHKAQEGQLNDHQQEMSSIRGQFDTLVADHGHARGRLDASEGSLDGYLRTLEETQTALDSVNAELDEMRSQWDTAKKDEVVAQNEAQILRSELDGRNLEVTQLTERLEELERLFDIMRQEKEQLTALTSGNLSELLSTSKGHRDREAELNGLSEQRLASVGTERDNYRDMHDKLRQGSAAADEELAKAQEKSHDLERQLLAVKAELSNGTTRHLSAQDEIVQLRAQLSSHQANMDQQLAKLDSESSKAAVLRSILSDHGLSENVSSAEGSPSLGSANNESNGLRRRVQELESNLEQSRKAASEQADQLKQHLDEQRTRSPASRDSKATEAELSLLQERHRGLVESHAKAVQYVKGTEKMLRKMKDEVNKHKARSEELEAQLGNGAGTGARSEVDTMRAQVGDLLRMSEVSRAENKQLSERLATVQSEFQQTLRQRQETADREAKQLRDEAAELHNQLEKAQSELKQVQKSGSSKDLQAANERSELPFAA